jgi:hypothetical protein
MEVDRRVEVGVSMKGEEKETRDLLRIQGLIR